MDFGTSLLAMVATVTSLGVPIAIVALVLWYKSRKTRLMHETAIRLAEKGQPVPPELFPGRPQPYSDLRRGWCWWRWASRCASHSINWAWPGPSA